MCVQVGSDNMVIKKVYKFYSVKKEEVFDLFDMSMQFSLTSGNSVF